MNKTFRETQEDFRSGTVTTERRTLLSEDIRSKVQLLTKMCEELDRAKTQFWKENEKNVIDLVTRIAKKVCMRELSSDPEYPVRLVRSIIEKIGVGESLKIRLNSNHSHFLETIRTDIREFLGDSVRIRFEFSDLIAEDACEVDTDLANVKTDLDLKIKMAQEVLLSK